MENLIWFATKFIVILIIITLWIIYRIIYNHDTLKFEGVFETNIFTYQTAGQKCTINHILTHYMSCDSYMNNNIFSKTISLICIFLNVIIH